MEYHIFLLILLVVFIPSILGHNVAKGKIVVDETTKIAETDENFICFTMDIWPHDECSQPNLCVWDDHASILNVDLSLPMLNKAVQAFKSLRIRIGGTLQDRLIYNVGEGFKSHCQPFQADNDLLFDFSEGCLYMERWDDLNNFFNNTGAIITFGLNALLGKHNTKGMQWEGNWNYSNAEALIQYTVDKNYQINSWEFGKLMGGRNSIGASVSASQYAKDLMKLREIIDRLYNNSQQKPLMVAPGAFFDDKWYHELVKKNDSNIVNALTHHIYNMGTGDDPKLIYRFVNPTYLSQVSNTFKQLDNIIQKHAPWASAWVGEAGGAYHGGSPHISDAFINSFWYLDQLGMASFYNTKVYCRQTLIGGFYSVLKSKTYLPTPDYYGALLFHRLMGSRVLKVDNNVSSYLRTYAHCSRGRSGVTLLFINLSNTTEFTIKIESHMNPSLHNSNSRRPNDSNLKYSSKVKDPNLPTQNGLLRSSTVLLNENPLELTKEGELPNFTPVYSESNSSINIATWSIAFIVIPDFVAAGCLDAP
ncbi:LOW QUALITY PROTEIN: heparanase-like protein 1 [Benincasa hispida]|uniref:LOW QUALITY PROTEIN: heparanase-like protein 1 n=1 Tax=Benincasa hispida TaxID=102211 RepID=UPI0019000682|nr:LOW QUALITY PROTEIN: heparanase-like protein 1 [Benincasa hispida]